jgi:hypothetical protein
MNAQDWLALHPNSVILLSDERNLSINMAGLTTWVKRIIKLPECNNLCTWILMELIDNLSNPSRWLMVKLVDDEIDLRLYRLPETFQRGNRHDLVYNDQASGHWMFQPPDDPSDIVLNDLVYTDEFEWDEHMYRKKAQGDFACGDFDNGPPIVELPQLSGLHNSQLATLAEYISSSAPDSEAVIFEIGDPDDDNGGFISLMIGYPLNPSDIRVLESRR